MQIDYRNYPHPVLSHFSDDFVRCTYQVTVRVNTTKNSYVLNVQARTSSRSLAELVATGKAQHAIHVECAATRFRKLVTSANEKFDECIPAANLLGRVQVCSMMIATADIPGYTSDEFHPDYGGRSFRVRRGDVLAVDHDVSFTAERDDHGRDVPSIFVISESKEPDPKTIDLDLDGDKIVILLQPALFQQFRQLSLDKTLAPLLSNLTVVPALVAALDTANSAGASEEGDLQARRWYRVIRRKLLEKGLKVPLTESTLSVAQELIGDPLRSAMPALTSLVEIEE